jgi:hypothetical protein
MPTIERPYVAYGGVLRLWESAHPETILTGAADTGKSRGCLEYLYAACQEYPGARR